MSLCVDRRQKRRKKRKTEIIGEGNNEIKKRQRDNNYLCSLSSGNSKKKIGLNYIDLYLGPQCVSQKTKAVSITKTNYGDRS
jgi:DNA mismatch repair ATPase MutS